MTIGHETVKSNSSFIQERWKKDLPHGSCFGAEHEKKLIRIRTY